MTGKGQQIISLLSGNTLASVQISRDFGSHGITAENPHKEGVSSLGRKSECPAPERSAPAKEFLQNLQVHKQRGQDKKGQHGGQECEEPQHQPGLCPQKGLPGKEQEQTEKKNKRKKRKGAFHKNPPKKLGCFFVLLYEPENPAMSEMGMGLAICPRMCKNES